MKQKVRQFVEHLRSKPESVKKQILSVSMAVVGLVLVLIWIGTLRQSTPPSQALNTIAAQQVAPFALLKANFFDTIHTVAAGVSSFRGNNTTTSDTKTTTPTAPETVQQAPANPTPTEPQQIN